MKEYYAEDFTKLTFELIEKYAKENPGHLRITYSGGPFFTGGLKYIHVCEKQIQSQRDFERWQEKIQISPLDYIPCLTKEGKLRDFREIIEDLKKARGYSISVCVKILKKPSDQEVIAELFGRLFLIKNPYRIDEGEYGWFDVRDDRHPGRAVSRFFELSKEEALAFIL